MPGMETEKADYEEFHLGKCKSPFPIKHLNLADTTELWAQLNLCKTSTPSSFPWELLIPGIPGEGLQAEGSQGGNQGLGWAVGKEPEGSK